MILSLPSVLEKESIPYFDSLYLGMTLLISNHNTLLIQESGLPWQDLKKEGSMFL